ncbi:alpha/beta fold hydrolase [Schaalia sp. lx-260]|uniref:alpha/beta fold hydrolase n=1 Tax=Schaalia sp. lx-260 TaxID=2899082 RepID=UPI001E63D78D|nr:alpha/beta hydrolase [Schaalia sp. lx-260]MCD4549264.1 alpha/beta hydrolase [Schaalia sp. lx-260]
MLNTHISGPAQAPLIVLCHGVTDSAASLADLITRLSQHFRLAAIDTLGHGLSPRLSSTDKHNPFPACSAALEHTVEHLVHLYGPACGIGHSMGGALLTQLAYTRPDLLRACIAEDPAWLTIELAQYYKQWGPQEAQRLLHLREQPCDALTSNRMDYPTWPDSERLPWLQAKYDVDMNILHAGIVGLTEPWIDVLPQLRVPFLVITSDGADVLLGSDGISRIDSAGNPLISSRLIAGARHCVRRENPAAFHEAISPFLHTYTR